MALTSLRPRFPSLLPLSSTLTRLSPHKPFIGITSLHSPPLCLHPRSHSLYRHSATLHPIRPFNSLRHRVPASSSTSRSWALTATVCVSAALACFYSTLASCDAAAVAAEATIQSNRDTAHRTFAPSPSQPLSPIPQLTGSNELDWQLVRQVQAVLAQPDASLTADEQHYLDTRMSDPSCCFRYLLARGGDVQRAAQAIKNTARWRLNNRVDELTAASLVDKLSDSHMWVSEGRARDGTPLILNKKSTKAETDHDRQFMLIVYTLERALRILALRSASLPPPTPPTPANPHPVPLSLASNERWSWFLDLAAFNSGSSTPMSETKRIVDALMSHYVERLDVVLILNAPSFFFCTFLCKHSHFARPRLLPSLSSLNVCPFVLLCVQGCGVL